MLIRNLEFKKSFLLGLVVAVFAHPPMAEAVDKGDCRLEGNACSRVEAIMKAWQSQPLAAFGFAEAGAIGKVEADQPTLEVDADNTKAREQAAIAGPCYYDSGEARIELTPAALKMSDAGLAECLAAALAQARYEEIEGRWLEQVGEHEAWVVKDGKVTKVAAEEKIPDVAARNLWASFATRELVALHRAHKNSAEEATGRAIASEAVTAAGDPNVRALLGFSTP